MSVAHRRNKTSHAVMAAIEREHQRFASELHDGICQELAGIAYTIDSLRPAVTADTAETLKCLSDHVRRLASDTKRLALGLAPLALESTGLRGALMLLQHEIQRSGGCELLLVLDENALRSLSMDVALNLFRIGQEATMNAIRHGKASSISIHLIEITAGIEFSVEDDGGGVGDSLLRPGGLGVYSMMWRAEWLGSELQVLPEHLAAPGSYCRWRTRRAVDRRSSLEKGFLVHGASYPSHRGADHFFHATMTLRAMELACVSLFVYINLEVWIAACQQRLGGLGNWGRLRKVVYGV